MTPIPIPETSSRAAWRAAVPLATKAEGGDHRDSVSGHECEGAEHVEEDDPSVHGPIVGWLSRARLATIG